MDGRARSLLYKFNPQSTPISGTYDFPPETLRFDSDVEHLYGVDDCTGDGLTDFVVENFPNDAPASTWYLVRGTTRGFDLDAERIGVALQMPTGAFAHEVVSADLDGDGLTEVVFRNPYYGHGGMWIFAGADIAASLAGG